MTRCGRETRKGDSARHCCWNALKDQLLAKLEFLGCSVLQHFKRIEPQALALTFKALLSFFKSDLRRGQAGFKESARTIVVTDEILEMVFERRSHGELEVTVFKQLTISINTHMLNEQATRGAPGSQCLFISRGREAPIGLRRFGERYRSLQRIQSLLVWEV